MWNGDNTSDHFAEAFKKLDDQLTNSRGRETVLETVYNQAKSAMDAGKPLEPVLMLVMTADGGLAFNAQENWYDASTNITDAPNIQFKLDTPSKQLEKELYAYEVDLRVMMDRLGEGHPSVATMRKKVDLTKKTVEKLRESERQLDHELNRLKDEAEANGSALFRSSNVWVHA